MQEYAGGTLFLHSQHFSFSAREKCTGVASRSATESQESPSGVDSVGALAGGREHQAQDGRVLGLCMIALVERGRDAACRGRR